MLEEAEIAAANRDWDRLLRAEPPALDELIAWQHQHQLVGTEPLCKVLRPGFVTTQQLAADQKAAEQVFSALCRAGDHIVAQAALRQRFLGIYWERYAEFFQLDCGHPHRCLNVRMDAYPTAAGLKFLELNTSPGGRNFVDLATGMFEKFAVFPRFAKLWQVESLLTEPARKAALQAVYRQWGIPERCTMVAFRRPAAETSKSQESAFALVCAAHAAQGINLLLVEPQELTFSGGRLRHGSAVIDVVSRSTLQELTRAGRPALEPLFAAVRARAVCLANPYDVYGNKALFAAVSDPGFDCRLTPAEQQAVRAHVPWTRVVRAELTADPEGLPVDLLPWAAVHRQHLVLKPCDGFAAQGVVLGWQTDAATWQRVLAEADSGQATHILQARVEAARTTWPLLAAGLPDSVWLADRNPFLAAGRMAGYIIRMNTSDLTNVSAGGGIAPVFVIRRR